MLSKQTFTEQPLKETFTDKVVYAFIFVDIPLRKLNHPAFKSLFATTRENLPSGTAGRASVVEVL